MKKSIYHKSDQKSTGRNGILCGLSNYYKTFKEKDFFFVIPVILFIVFGIRLKLGITDILGINASFYNILPIILIYFFIINKIDKRFVENKPMVFCFKIIHWLFWPLTPFFLIFLIWTEISIFCTLHIKEGILTLFIIWILYKYCLFGFEYYSLFIYRENK